MLPPFSKSAIWKRSTIRMKFLGGWREEEDEEGGGRAEGGGGEEGGGRREEVVGVSWLGAVGVRRGKASGGSIVDV